MKTYDSTKMISRYLSNEEIKAAEILNIKYFPSHIRESYYDRTPLHVFSNESDCIKRCRTHAPKVRREISAKMDIENHCTNKSYTYDEFISVIVAEHRKKVAHEAAMLRNRNKIMKDNAIESEYSVFSCLNTGENTGDFCLRYGKQNRVLCEEFADHKNGYARSCKFTMIRRNFTLEIKRGWHVRVINRTITFYRTTIAEGAKVEIVVQGRAIREISTITAYIVDGKPVIGKSLKEAKANA